MCKALIAGDDAGPQARHAAVLDVAFIAMHTHGFEAFADAMRADAHWDDIERESGLDAGGPDATAAGASRVRRRVIGVYGMGLTQHRKGVQNVQMLTEPAAAGRPHRPARRGHLPGARATRTCRASAPSASPRSRSWCRSTSSPSCMRFEPPRDKGLNTVETCERRARRFGARLHRPGRQFPARRARHRTHRGRRGGELRLTVQIATKLNRSHLVHGEVAYLLPCLGRIEIDRQAQWRADRVGRGLDQLHACLRRHGRAGRRPRCCRRPAIVAGIAKATLAPNPTRAVGRLGGRLRRACAMRSRPPGRRCSATSTAASASPAASTDRSPRANASGRRPTARPTSSCPTRWSPTPTRPRQGDDALRLMTMRSDDQFNTTHLQPGRPLPRRLRHAQGAADERRPTSHRLGLAEGATVTARTAVDDGVLREVAGAARDALRHPARLRAAGYYPECNPLIPLRTPRRRAARCRPRSPFRSGCWPIRIRNNNSQKAHP